MFAAMFCIHPRLIPSSETRGVKAAEARERGILWLLVQTAKNQKRSLVNIIPQALESVAGARFRDWTPLRTAPCQTAGIHLFPSSHSRDGETEAEEGEGLAEGKTCGTKAVIKNQLGASTVA